MRHVTPKTYLIACTQLEEGLWDYLDSIQQTQWHSDTENSPDLLTEVAGRLCYRSWEAYNPEKGADSTNKNVTRVREGNEQYIRNLIGQMHGSVLEHANLTFLFQNVSRVFTHELVRHRAGMGYCVTGDTEVWSGAQENGHFNGVKKKWTIRELYEKTLSSHGRSRLRLATIRCFDGTRFVPAGIRNVYQSGIKDVFEMVLENGRTIKASALHRFFTEDGWKELQHLTIGQPLACNGKTVAEREAISYRMTGSGNHQWQGDLASEQAGRQRAQRMYAQKPCVKCGHPGQRHHKDGNTLNNEQGNIEFLCASCHGLHHAAINGSPNVLTISWSKIVSIKPIGQEMTYDLSVNHPAHNFVANGIVTHNSQESLRYVLLTDLGFWMPPDMPDFVEEAFDSVYNYVEAIQSELAQRLGLENMTFADKKMWTSRLRRIVPMGVATNIIATGNLRSWRHVFTMRSSPGAEEEIRMVQDQLAPIFKDIAPGVFCDLQNSDGVWSFEGSPKRGV